MLRPRWAGVGSDGHRQTLKQINTLLSYGPVVSTDQRNENVPTESFVPCGFIQTAPKWKRVVSPGGWACRRWPTPHHGPDWATNLPVCTKQHAEQQRLDREPESSHRTHLRRC